MEQETDVGKLVAEGDRLLVEGKVTDAADRYSRALQLDQNAVGAHLGVAKAYLALGSYGYVQIACQRVQQFAPDTAAAALARAILLVLDQRYDAAIKELERAEQLEPGEPYVHALRGYCYRRLGNSFDAMSAESKAARLSGVREWSHLFPKAQALPAGLPGQLVASPWQNPATPALPTAPGATQQEMPRPWTERSPIERRMVRARFATRTTPIVTMSLIFLNVVVYIVCAQLSSNIFEPFNPNNPLYANGAEVGTLILRDPTQAYRIVTAMFLHANYLHILLNMLSLYVIGSITERLYGGGSYLLLYFVSGIIAGLAEAFIQPNAAAVGASGAIFGIFGAFGAYLILRRRELGPVAGPLTSQWVFMLVLNLFISVSVPGIALWDHIGGLVAGFAIGAFLLALQQQRSRG